MYLFMKLNLGFFFLAPLFASCSNSRDLASSAKAEEFEGQWYGSWSWQPNHTATIRISGKQAIVSQLPVVQGLDDRNIRSVTAEGETRFYAAYGPKGLPCILLSFPDVREMVPIFITNDKHQLYYSVSDDRLYRIRFNRR